MKRSAGPHLLPLLAQEFLSKLGERVSLARRARMLTQTDLADQVGIGLSTMRKIEAGESSVQIGFYVMALSTLDLLHELQAPTETLGRMSSIGVLLEGAANEKQPRRRR